MNFNLRQLNDGDLHDLMTNIINTREGVQDGTRFAEQLDEWYLEVDNEIAYREGRTV